MRLAHRSSSGNVAIDWGQESLGTRSWYSLLGPLLVVLDEGAVLLVDELDASLHPRFAAEVVRLFHDPLANPRGAQLVFTSHDPSILTTPSGGRLLEPGQVWLTEKDKHGATELYPVTAAEPGADEDLMKSYLAGAFGAVPQLLEGQIARRLLTTTGRRDGHDAEGSFTKAKERAEKMNEVHGPRTPLPNRDPYTDVYAFVEDGLGIVSY